MGEMVLQPGTEVDASGWKNSRILEEQRYLRPLNTTSEFDTRVVTAVVNDLRAGGPLAQQLSDLIQPNERTQRMGRKDNANTRN